MEMISLFDQATTNPCTIYQGPEPGYLLIDARNGVVLYVHAGCVLKAVQRELSNLSA